MGNTKVTANDVLDVMRSWIGKSRSAGTHKDIIDLYNSHKPLALGYAVTYYDDYCDTTVSAAFIKLDAVDLIGGTECGVERHVGLFKQAGIWQEDGTVTPKPGWIIVYNWDDNTQPNDGFSDHIGIVETVSGDLVTLIEGNMNDGVVGRRTISIGWGYIRGYAIPKYSSSADSQQEDKNKKSISEIAQEVLNGKWGNGDDRVALLTAAGYDYNIVQSAVNALVNSGVQTSTTTQSSTNSNTSSQNKTTNKPVKTVIDVSYAQPDVNWDKVKSQIDGVILRCGYGSDEVSQDDKQWARNIVEVERLGIPYGVYLYSYADTVDKIKSEISHTIRLIKGHNPKLGVFLDLEESKNGFIAAQAAKTWCNQIKAAGYKPGIYCGAYFYKSYLSGVHEAVDALWWIAGYGTNTGVPQLNYKPNTGFAYDAWQYTSVKTYNGIVGGVDTSEWYADFDSNSTDDVIRYRGHVQSFGWMDYVENGAVCGTSGLSKRLEAIEIIPPSGVTLNVMAHVQSFGDKLYTGITREAPQVIGTTGLSKRLEGITIKCTRNTTGKKLKYQGHCQTYGDTKVCFDGEFCGTKGESKRLEAIRIWFE